MGREDLRGQPQFMDQTTRGQHADAVDDVLIAWTRTLSKRDVVDRLRANKIPVAPVRTLPEVANDENMHARGMLNHINHPEFGNVVLPRSPLRFGAETPVTLQPSPSLGEHSGPVLTDWLQQPGTD